jgi:hypothetical protein
MQLQPKRVWAIGFEWNMDLDIHSMTKDDREMFTCLFHGNSDRWMLQSLGAKK